MTDEIPDRTRWLDASVAPSPERPRLTFDLDVDLCIVGGGVAGLTTAREAARLGATVAVLESREVGWSASGFNVGSVMPGFAADMAEIVERVGLDHARELWSLSQQGVDYVRETVALPPMAGVATADGAVEVHQSDRGAQLERRLRMITDGLGADVSGWSADEVRSVLQTSRYAGAIHYPGALNLHSLNYVRGLAVLAEQGGVRIFENTPAVSIDPDGIRKRVVTANGRLRASFIVLAGNIHHDTPLPRLRRTLLPMWRQMALTEPLGEGLRQAVNFAGTVTDSYGIDHYRVVDGDRLLWSSPNMARPLGAGRFARQVAGRIRKTFPALSGVKIAEVRSGVTGNTVHGMPQIGELSRGVWVASGFGSQGLNTSAMAGQIVAAGMLAGDDRWRLFSPFELVWSGGPAGRVVAQAAWGWTRAQAAMDGALARYVDKRRSRQRLRTAVTDDPAAVTADIGGSANANVEIEHVSREDVRSGMEQGL